MFEGIKNFARQAVSKMNVLLNGENFMGTAGEADTMVTAIQEWFDLYQGNAPWLARNKQSIGLPAAIASEMARLVTLEMEVKVNPIQKEPDKSKEENEKKSKENDRTVFLEETLKPFFKNIRNYTEYACATGGVMFKPFFNGEGVSIECVQAVDFKPVAYDNKGNITACKFVERKTINNTIYSRLETHELSDTTLTVTNKCYKSNSTADRGVEVPLNSVQEWAEIEPVVEMKNVKRPLYQYFKIPLGNTINPNSPLGISVYGRASDVELIKEADLQWQRLLWEFEGGELAIDVSESMFPNDKNGVPIIPAGKERLFRPNRFDPNDTSGELIKIFSPALRDASIKSGLNAILQRIEFNVGLAYGTLSDPQQIEKTAEEIRASKQRSYSTVSNIQTALEDAITGLIEAINVTCELYGLGGNGECETAFIWDDSIIVDADTERARDLNDVRQGIMQKWEYRMKWYGEDEETAKSKIMDSLNEPTDPFSFGGGNNPIKQQKAAKNDDNAQVKPKQKKTENDK